MSQAPSSTTQSTAPLLFNRYRVHEQLGEGRLAAVYRATDERLHRAVLVHLLRKDLVGQEAMRNRFIEEATASARRSHPALLEVFDSGEVANRPFMITEYAVGRPLRVLGVLTIEDALLYIRQIVGAVATCQAQGVPHPPISSSNVLVVDEGRVKLVESWLTPPASVTLDLAFYRPPERTQGQPPSPANAVYSLGLLLYEMITGQRPIKGDDPRAVAQAHLTTHIPTLSEVRPMLYFPSLDRLVARAIARAPEQRMPNAAALAEALDEVRREIGATTQRLQAAPPPRRRAGQTAVDARPQQVNAAPIANDPAYNAVPPPSAPARRLRNITLPGIRRETQPGLSRADVQRQSMRRAIVGWLVALVLLSGVVYGSYVGASYLVDQFFAIKLPQVSLPNLPGWAGGQPAEILIVQADELNVRSAPGINTQVETTLPKGALVTKLEGPVTENDVPWVRVRAEVNGQSVEGWVSERFLEKQQSQ